MSDRSQASDSIQRISRIYDDLAPTWNTREGRGERLLMGNDLRRWVGEELQGDILEIGSGTGATFASVDWDRVTSYTATDLSAGMLDEARRHPDAQTRPITFQPLEATILPYPDKRFDTVTTSLTLCTVPDPERTLREMSRVCRPEGRIVLLEHVRPPNPILAKLAEWATPMQVRRMGCHFDRRTDRLVEDMGFDVVRHERRFFSIFRLLVLRPLEMS